MDTHLLDLCRGYLDSQKLLAKRRATEFHPFAQQPAITISRETGAGAVSIARLLAERLQSELSRGSGEESTTPGAQWAVFDRNIVEKVLEDHEMPAMMKRFLPEDSLSAIPSAVEEIFGLHPSAWTLVQRSTETILRLAKLGNAILIGRGGAIITANLKHMVHVRLVAPRDWRVNHCMDFYQLNRAAAEKLVHERDAGRIRYVQKYFHTRIDDPMHYHLTINTGKVGFSTAADAIIDCVKTLEAGAPAEAVGAPL